VRGVSKLSGDVVDIFLLFSLPLAPAGAILGIVGATTSGGSMVAVDADRTGFLLSSATQKNNSILKFLGTILLCLSEQSPSRSSFVKHK